jgi:zinc transporter
VHAFEFDPGGNARALADPADWTGRPKTLWLHVDYSVAGARTYLEGLGVPTYAADILCEPDTRPRTASVDGGTLVILRGVNLNPGADPEDMVSIRFFLEPNRLVSVRQRRLLSVVDVRTDLEAGTGPRSITEAFARVLRRINDRIDAALDEIDETIAGFETGEHDHLLARRLEVASLKRQTAAIRRFLAPQRDALNQLARDVPAFVEPAVAHEFREEANRITRVVEDLDMFRERAVVLQEQYLAEAQQQQNTRMYVLSIVTVIFLPLSFITGLFGMNVAGLPGIEEHRAFLWVSLGMLTCGGGVLAALKWLRWF